MTTIALAPALAVLPYVQAPDLKLGPVTLHGFGLLVAVGVLVGYRLARGRARLLGLDPTHFERLVGWTVATGFVLSHVLDTVFYHPEVLRTEPWRILWVPDGLSSFGGFFGATVGFGIYVRRHRLAPWPHADAIGYGLAFGWLFGRAGCALVHDHPGRRADHPLAVAFPDGPRFDLGLLEFLLVPALIAAVVLVARRTRRPGSVVATLALVYPVIRFPLDLLRASAAEGGDARYLGLTPGQYASALLFAFGLFALARARRAAPPAAAAA